MKKLSLTLMIVFIVLSVGCKICPDPKEVLIFQFDLNSNSSNWLAGFSDYPNGADVFYELASGWKQLPAPLESLNGIYVTGNNHSDDLFMFIKHKLSGLKPHTSYSLFFHVQIATNADSGCVGIGGAPGESVYVKTGATSYEPIASPDSYDYISMNIDKGNQSVGGSDAIVIGDVANTQTDCLDNLYELKNLDSSGFIFNVFTDQAGSLWALFATDSGFEGITGIYFTHIEIRATEI